MIYYKKIYLALLFTMIFGILNGCATLNVPEEPPDNNRSEEILSEYIIQPGDSLLIDIIENVTLSRTVPVRPDGKISLPQVNDIQAAGLTPMQLRENLFKVYEQFYNVVEVAVTMTNMTGYKINVIGNVSRQGQIIMNDKTTFLEAISLAGGLGEWADTKNIFIMRRINGRKKRIRADYDKIIRGKKEDILMLPGDIIIVE